MAKNTLNVSNIKKRQQANTPSGMNVFDAVKQNKYQNTITGALEMLVPEMTTIKNSIVAIAGAVYGNKMVNDTTKYTELLGSISGPNSMTAPLKGLTTNLEKWVKNSDALTRSTNTILATMSANIERMLEEKKDALPQVQERRTDTPINVQVEPIINVPETVVNVAAPVIPAPIVNVESAGTSLNTLELETKLTDIYDVLTIDLKDAIVNNNYKPTVDTINRTLDSIKMSIDTHLNSIESIVRTINNKDYSDIIKSFNDVITNFNTQQSNNVALGTAQIQIALSGISQGDIDGLMKLAALKIDPNSILGNKVDLTAICSNLEQLSKLKNFEDILDVKWIPNDVEDRFFKVLQLTNSVKAIIDDIVNIDEEKLKTTNSMIALMGTVDVYAFIDMLDNFSALGDLTKDEYKWLSDTLLLERFENIRNVISQLDTTMRKAITLSIYSGVVSEFSNEIKSSVNDIYIVLHGDAQHKGVADIVGSNVKWDASKFDSIDEVFSRLSKLTASVIGYGVFTKVSVNAINALIGFVDRLVNNKDGLYVVLNKLPNFTKYTKKLEATGVLFETIKKIAIGSAYAAVLYPLAKVGINATIKLIQLIQTVVSTIDIDEKKVKDMSDKLSSFKNLLIVSAGVMLLGALTGAFILANLPSLLGFTAALAGFIIMTVGAYNLATRGMTEAMSSANEFAKLLAVSSMLLFVGALTGGYIASNIVSITLFTATLSAFIFAVVGTYNLATKGMKEAISSASEFNKLLIVSAGILILAGSIMSAGDIGAALMFGATLGAFVLSMSYIYKYVAENISRDMLKRLDEFNDLVTTSSLILLAGASLVVLFPWLIAGALGYTILLGTFIYGVTWAYTKNTKDMHQALRQAPALAILITVSSAILIAAAFIMTEPGLWVRAIGFGVLLATFIYGVTLAYTKGTKGIMSSFLPMIALTTLVAISGAVLIAAGKFMTLKDVGAALIFGGVLAAFVIVMGFTAKLLSTFARNIGLGLLVMLGITGIVAVAGLAFEVLAQAVNKFGGPDALASTMTTFTLAIAALGGIAALLGTFAAPVALGEVVLAGLVGIVYLASEALNKIALAIKSIKDSGMLEIEPIRQSIRGFISLIDEFGPLANPLNLIEIKASADTVASMSESLAAIASVTQAYASMQIPVYEGTKIVGYKKMSNNDFTNAGKNIATIITTLGTAINDVYTNNPELFETSGGFLGMGGKSNFAKVCTACKSLSSMLASIAESVKDYAELNVRQYDANGNVIAVRTLSHTDFSLAASNVREIIMTLGKAVIDTYNGNEEMFETSGGIFGFGSKSVFTKVCISCEAMGEMLAGIAKNVKDYAELNVPIYENGKVVGTRVLSTNDFKEAAKNVGIIIDTLGGAIIDTYNNNTEMFETTGGILGFGSKSVFTKVCISCEAMGQMLSGIAKNVKDYASLTIPIYDASGKEIGVRQLKEQDFTDAANNVRSVIETLGAAIVTTYNMNPSMFETTGGILGFGSKSVFTKVCVSCNAMGDMIANISEGVKDYASLNIPVYGEDGKIIDRKKLSESDFNNAAKNISTIILTLGTGLITAFENKKDWFEDDSWFGNKPSSTPFGMMVGSLGEMGKMISSVTESVKQFALGQIPVYDANGKITSYIKIDTNTLSPAAQKIADIITTLGTGLMTAFGEHPDWFTDDSWFGKKAERTPFGMLIASTAGMGQLVSGVAQAVIDVANMSFVDPVTNKTIKVTPAHITQVGNRVGLMFDALFGSLSKVYEKYEDNILDDDGEQVELIKKCITDASSMLSELSNSIVDVVSLKIADQNISEAISKVPALLTDIMLAVPTAVNNSSEQVLQTRKVVPNIKKAVDDYKVLLDSYSDCWETIAGMYNENTLTILDNMTSPTNRLNQMIRLVCESCNGIVVPDVDAVSSIDSVMSTYASIIEQVASVYRNNISQLFDEDIQQIAQMLTSNNTIKSSIIALNEMFVNVQQPRNKYIVDTFRAYESTVDEIVSIYSNIGTLIRTIGSEMFESIKTMLPTLNGPIESLMQAIMNSNVDVDAIEEYNEDFVHIYMTVANISELVSLLKKIDTNVLKNFVPLFEAYIAAIESVQYLGNIDVVALEEFNKKDGVISAIVNSIVRMNAAIAGKDFTNIANFEQIARQYRDGVVMMSEAYETMANMHAASFDTVISDLFDSDDDIFSKALKGVNDVISVIESSTLDKFDRQNTELSEFTQTVNSLDLNKANTMIHLTESLNALATNMGNLDGLTESIAVKLSGVLDRLVTELGSTKETFKTAERIQKTRHEHIDKSIKEMEKLVNKPMLIEVAPKKEEEDENKKNKYATESSTTKTPVPQGAVSSGSGISVTHASTTGAGTTTGSDLRFGNTTNNNYTTYNTNNRNEQPNVRGNYSNVSSNVRSIVKSVFEEMIMKYNLDGNRARGNARPS